MPTYQYSCTDCGHFFEAVQSFTDDSLTVCPECEGRLRKVFNAVGVVFKGSGFYRNDSRSESGQRNGADERRQETARRAPPRTARRASPRAAPRPPTPPRPRGRRDPRGPRAPPARRPPPRPDPLLTRAPDGAVDCRRTVGRIGLPSGAMNLLPPPGPLGRVLRLVRRLRRRVLLHRRLLAALCAGAAVLVGLQAAAPPPPETVTVWTAARDLAGGDVLGADDLTATRLRARRPCPTARSADPAAVVGRTLAAPLTRGEPLTRVSTLARGLLRGYPGTTAVPLRITDAAIVDLLRVGDRISLVVADPDGRRTPSRLVDDVPVIAIPKVHESLSSGTPGRLVVAAIPSDGGERGGRRRRDLDSHPRVESLASPATAPEPVGSRRGRVHHDWLQELHPARQPRSSWPSPSSWPRPSPRW